MYVNYKVIKEEDVKDLDGKGTVLEHVKTGARVLLISNSDSNKVFNIIFRTPPEDDTGLPHILEHSVLCGSRKFPVKDPFVELAKGSLNTFLNAMTYPDKTMYPVASCNNKDFDNLMDVYLDAVFFPNIYNDPRILMQEGWHYEMDSPDGEIIYNGVVYNEMKGASSSPEQVLFRQIQAALFPDHPYGYDSGGDPYAIPTLTLERFLDFHRRYYHPSNSFIYLYGDMDMEEKLKWLDENYLSGFERIEIDSSLKEMPAFESRTYVKKPYAVASDADIKDRTYLSYNVAFRQPSSHCEAIGLEILEYMLLEAPGAPLKEALLDLEIAEDIFGSYDSGLNQPTFSIVAKNADGENEKLFVDTIEKVLKEIVEKGVDRKKAEAAINNFEFKTREADFGQYPKGIIYSLKALDTWLYDRDPLTSFYYDQAFSELRQGLMEGCFERLIETFFLDNSHCAVLQLVPDKGLLSEKEEETKAVLKAYRDTLTDEEKSALIEETEKLKAFQAEPNKPEELATIPLLSIDDIQKEAMPLSYETRIQDDVTYILHRNFTNNIVYGRVLFDFSGISMEDLPVVSLLGKLLVKVDTDNYTYSELTDEINLHTGGISVATNIYGVNGVPDECQARLEVKFKCFGNKIEKAVELVKEIVSKSRLTDTKRIYDLLSERRSRMSMSLISSGHQVAMTRSLSYHSLVGQYKDAIDGIRFYRFLESVETAAATEGILAKLQEVADKVLVKNSLTVLINTEEELMSDAVGSVSEFVQTLPVAQEELLEEPIRFESKNEGFKSSSKVQYNALSGNFIEEGYSYTGYMKVLQTVLSLDYMWTEVRIKGGAYGGFAGFRRSGTFFLGSYRDPNLKKTYEIYSKLPDYVRAMKLDRRELTKYIIGTISNLDTPLTPSMKGERALNMFMSGISNEDFQTERDEVIGCSVEDLVAIADMLEKVIEQHHICVIGNETTIENEKDILGEVHALLK